MANTYTTYKDSGIPWIGEIPKEWNMIRIKNVCLFNPTPKPINYEVIGYAPMNTIRYGKIDATEIKNDNLPSGLTYFEDGDIVMAKVTPCFENGNIAIASNLKNGCAYGSSELFVFRPTNIYTQFLFYALQNEIFKSLCIATMTGTGGLKRISAPFVANSFLPTPPPKEQIIISNFLDEKCSEIDALISLQENMIDELKAYKQSVITEVVTKGLDRNVKMKDSGVDWIGEIPEHWETPRIGNFFHLRGEKNTKAMDEVQLLSLYTGIGVFPHGEQEERGNKAVTVDGYKVVHKNDIVVNIILAWMGAIGVSDYDGVTSPAYDVYIPEITKVIPHYYHYVFRATGFAGECYKYGRGIMMMRWRTYSNEFKQISIPYPPYAEQKEIATFLDTKCSEIDTLISIKEKKIEELKDYKKSLIYEYVTGKKRV